MDLTRAAAKNSVSDLWSHHHAKGHLMTGEFALPSPHNPPSYRQRFVSTCAVPVAVRGTPFSQTIFGVGGHTVSTKLWISYVHEGDSRAKMSESGASLAVLHSPWRTALGYDWPSVCSRYRSRTVNGIDGR